MKNVTIIGVGALGSHVALALRNEANLRVVDFDRVEMRNVASQFYFKGSTGKKKVEALAQGMSFAFGKTLVTNGNRLVHDNATQLLGSSDLLIDCLDNAEGRRVIQSYAKENVPCLHGALAANGEFGRVVWTDDFMPDEAAPGAVTCEDGDFLPFIMLVSSLLAYSAQRFLRTGKKAGFMITPAGVVSV